MANNLSFLAASGLTFLTEQQRTAYLLRAENMTYQRIGEKMGITASAAGEHVKNAERRIREYMRYQNFLERNRQLVEMPPLTRGELQEILAGLRMLRRELSEQTRRDFRTAWKEKEIVFNRYKLVFDLVEKMDTVLQEAYEIEERNRSQRYDQMPEE